MKIAYFDCQFGAAGDMLNAALLAAGLDQKAWESELRKLALPWDEFDLGVSEVIRCGIVCKKFDVFDRAAAQALDVTNGHLRESSHSQELGHSHTHDEDNPHPQMSHSHGEQHAHPHTHEHSYAHEHRGLREILELISQSGISSAAKELASRIFHRLANAESQVHGTSPEEVHFHEVGAVDAIIDIVGFSLGYTMLGIEKSYCSAVPLGSGKVNSAHGIYPVPGPATTYLLSEAHAKIGQSQIDFECLTPTGAAILCEIAGAWDVQPSFESIAATGNGAGTKDTDRWPNVCRVMLGDAGNDAKASGRFNQDTVIVLETNIDDMNPQALAYSLDRFLSAGALDCFVIPAIMKKGRAGHLLTVIAKPADVPLLEEMIIAETTSIGVRSYSSQRTIALREWRTVRLALGQVRVKIARDRSGLVLNVQPEFEDCAAYAREHCMPLKEVMRRVFAAHAELLP